MVTAFKHRGGAPWHGCANARGTQWAQGSQCSNACLEPQGVERLVPLLARQGVGGAWCESAETCSELLCTRVGCASKLWMQARVLSWGCTVLYGVNGCLGCACPACRTWDAYALWLHCSNGGGMPWRVPRRLIAASSLCAACHMHGVHCASACATVRLCRKVLSPPSKQTATSSLLYISISHAALPQASSMYQNGDWSGVAFIRQRCWHLQCCRAPLLVCAFSLAILYWLLV